MITCVEASADDDACLPSNLLPVTRRMESPSTGLGGEMEDNCGLEKMNR